MNSYSHLQYAGEIILIVVKNRGYNLREIERRQPVSARQFFFRAIQGNKDSNQDFRHPALSGWDIRSESPRLNDTAAIPGAEEVIFKSRHF